MEIREFKSYKELVDVFQKDIEELPIVYHFGSKNDTELQDKLKKIGAKCLAECTSVYECGDIIRKVDVHLVVEMRVRHNKEMKKFMEDDTHLKDAILSEMYNHEYGLTCDCEEVLGALGLDSKILVENKRFNKIFVEAHNECIKNTY